MRKYSIIWLWFYVELKLGFLILRCVIPVVLSKNINKLMVLMYIVKNTTIFLIVKGKAVPLQVWSGSEGSRKLRFPDFMTTAQNTGKVVSLTHRPPLPQEIHLVLTSVRGWVDPRAIVRPEWLCHWKISMTPTGNRTRDMPDKAVSTR